MDEPLRALIEVHQRDGTLVMARAATADQPGGRRRWVVGDLISAGGGAHEVGSLVRQLIDEGVQSAPAPSAAEANGQWCAAFGQDTLDGLIDGLQGGIKSSRRPDITMDRPDVSVYLASAARTRTELLSNERWRLWTISSVSWANGVATRRMTDDAQP